MNEETAPKRRGRPPKLEGERKAGNLTIRTYGDLRQRLEDAAHKSGRSVSGEVEFILEQYFSNVDQSEKTAKKTVRELRESWFGSKAMFDNALVYAKLLNRFLDTKLTLEQYKANKARAKEVLLSAHKDLIDHLFMALAHQKEFEAVWVPHDAEGTSGTTSVREMMLAIRASAIQTQVLSHLMLEEHTPDELEWDYEEQEGTNDDNQS